MQMHHPVAVPWSHISLELVAVALGAWFVERPVALIRRSVRALGHRRIVSPSALHPVDEQATPQTAASERTVTRERLRHADRLQTIGQLASGVAHELGTPLSVIGMRARLIASGEATGRQAQASAAAILDQSARMTAIVRQLLDYARRQGSPMGLVDLRQVVSGALAMLEPLAQELGVRVELRLPEEPVIVRGDKTQLQQVVTNVAVNGIQAMPRGGRLRIEVAQGQPGGSLARADAHADFARIRVTDDGPGVPPEILDHVFDPFFTTKPVGEGTGLGLAVVQTIVQEHGGSVTVSSEPGHGASFTVLLPPAREQPALERLAS
jgi:two-component system, NtrC family, sensor kinase